MAPSPTTLTVRPSVRRPCDRSHRPATPVPAHRVGVAGPAKTAARGNGRSAAPANGDPASKDGPVTRIDRTHPVTIVGREDLGRRIRAHQWRRVAAIVLWAALVAIIIMVVFVGSQPAPLDF